MGVVNKDLVGVDQQSLFHEAITSDTRNDQINCFSEFLGFKNHQNIMLHHILQMMVDLPWLHVSATGILLANSELNNLSLIAQINFDQNQKLNAAIIDCNQCLSDCATEVGGPLFSFDEGEFKCISKCMLAHMSIGIPIKMKGFFLGILVVNIESGHKCSNNELQAIDGYANLLAQFINTEKQRTDKQLADLVLSHSSHGIMITNSYKTIMWVNSAFEEVTGYSLDEVTGSSPVILSSGKHDPRFYADMWAQIKCKGSWQGEVWNKRKNGDIYPEFLNIISLKSRNGAVLHYVGIFVDLTTIKAAEERVHRMAYFDDLTGLSSRASLMQHLKSALKRIDKHGKTLALLFIDLDEFKKVNDCFGHDLGDRYLKAVAGRLKKQLRDSDFIARLGGDEFCIMIDDIVSNDYSCQVARNCLQAMQEPLELDGQLFKPKGSIGIAFYPEDASSKLGLLKSADSAMYAAKTEGKHQYKFYSKKLSRRVERRLLIERDLEFAIEKNEYILHYQPKVDVLNGQIKGVEALIRWQHSTLGLIPPDEFIEIAESIGFIDKIGLWVLETACKQLIDWKNQGLGDLTMAVNISTLHFDQPGFVDDVEKIILKTKLPTELIELEITESMARDIKSHINTCAALASKGIQVAIDDFGTGYSSLSVLRHLPVNTLKIDKSFVDNMQNDPQTVIVLGGIMAIAKGLNFNVVVEGVETVEQLIILHNLDCDLIQGYFFSKPVTASEIPSLVKKGFAGLV